MSYEEFRREAIWIIGISFYLSYYLFRVFDRYRDEEFLCSRLEIDSKHFLYEKKAS